MIKIPKFRRSNDRIKQYEAIADDGARLVVVYNDQWESWFWYIQRKGQTTVAGSAPDWLEAQERAISAWIATRWPVTDRALRKPRLIRSFSTHNRRCVHQVGGTGRSWGAKRNSSTTLI